MTNQEQGVALERYGLEAKAPAFYDASRLSDYANCPSLYYHRHILGRSLRGAQSAALSWGTKWHEAMYVLHESWDLEAALAEVEKNWPTVLNHQDPKNRTLDRMRTLLTEYYAKYQSFDRFEFKTLRREEYFEIQCDADSDCPFGGCDFSWCGRIDRIVENRRKRILILDFKTTSYLRNTYFVEQENGFQIPGYVWAGMHLTGGGRMLGAQIDLLHTIKNTNGFYRQEFRYPQSKIQEWLSNTKRYVEQVREMEARYLHDPEAWNKNWNHCDRFGGCQFKVIHHIAPISDTRLRILEEDYEDQRWDPAAILEAPATSG